MTHSHTPPHRRNADVTAFLAQTDWTVEDPEGHLAAQQARRALGAWPRRLLKTCVFFDPDDPLSYGGQPGHTLAGIAARIVLTSRHENRFLYALRGLAGAMIAPILAYLRVNYALGRLDEEIDSATARAEIFSGFEDSEMPPPVTGKPKRGTCAAKPRAFKWRRSPASVYGFAEKTKAQGYDPRETSVYWIEKRAGRLRRQWERYANPPQGDGPIAPPDVSADLPPSFESPGVARPQGEEVGVLRDRTSEAVSVKDFKPCEADYDTIWPPIYLPDGPPKTPSAVTVDNSPHAPLSADVEGVNPALEDLGGAQTPLAPGPFSMSQAPAISLHAGEEIESFTERGTMYFPGGFSAVKGADLAVLSDLPDSFTAVSGEALHVTRQEGGFKTERVPFQGLCFEKDGADVTAVRCAPEKPP